MSGVEFIVGTILGGVPVAILAFEKYQTLSTLLATARNPREVVRMQSKVGAQRTIFRNSAINLLSAITNDRDSIHSWMTELTKGSKAGDAVANPSLKMPDMYLNRVDSLKDTFSSCKTTLDEILATIEKISEELSGLATAVGTSMDSGTSSSKNNKEWFSKLNGRLKLALRKSDIAETIEDLRNLNSDFSVMTSQIVSALDEIKTTQTYHEKQATGQLKRAASNINHIEAYRRIQQASNVLYDTLAKMWTCLSHEHEGHLASVSCIGPEHIEATQVKFEVALTVQQDNEGPKADKRSGPLWLEVEYVDHSQEHVTIVGTHVDHRALEELSAALTTLSARSISSASVAEADNKATRKVRFDVEPTLPIANGTSTKPRSNDTSQPVATQIDSMLALDFCGTIHTQYQSCLPRQCFLGCLGEKKQLQRFYIPSADRRLSNEPKSLATIITWVGSASLQRCLPLPVALHIASSLAASVLQFHSTPWLPETWRSQDIRFFSADELSIESGINLSHPHFQANFSKHPTNGVQANETDPTVDSKEVALFGARNEMLFRLGIVLLEVGFSRQWYNLREEILASNKLPPNRRTDYHVAEKLCAILMNQMGPRYPRIVRKCIGCDFGLDEPQDNLEASEELQAVFLVDVVIELQHLKNRVQSLG